MQSNFDDEFLAGAQSSLDAGRYACAVGLAWSAITSSLGHVRNQYLDYEEPQWRSIGWFDDSKQSMIFQLLAKMAGIDTSDNIAFEIERLHQQQIDAELTPKPVSREDAIEAIERARRIEKQIRELLPKVPR